MCVFPSILFGQEMFDLKEAAITVNIKDSTKYNIAVFLQQEILKRTGIELAIKSKDEYCTTPQVKLVQDSNVKTFARIQSSTLTESYAISASKGKDLVPVVTVTGYDNRGLLFGAGRLVRELYLSENYISLLRSTNISSSPSSALRAQQIILNSQGNDGFRNWKDRKINKDFVNEMLLFGTNGFEPTQPDLIDEYLQSLDVDLFVKLKCQDIIDLHTQTDQAIKGFFKQYVGVDHITTYGGDATGAVAPQLFFPFLDHVIPLVLAGQRGAKWWYSNQCLEDHAKDYDDYIFPFINKYKPSYLHGLVYGPWTKRGINEIRNDLPSQYVIRHFPDICHPRWSQYPVPEWDRTFAIVWPRNKSIYMMPSMMLYIFKATQKNTVGFLPYNHTGSFNDLNKFVWSYAGWDFNADINTILNSYAKSFFSYGFIKSPLKRGLENRLSKKELIDEATAYVAQGLKLLEANWIGSLNQNTSTEEALIYWKNIANCIGGPEKNWRVEMFLCKARIDAQIKRKFDKETMLETEVYSLFRASSTKPIKQIQEETRNILERIEKEFQSKEEFLKELQDLGISNKYGDLNEVVNNIYTSFNDRYWISDELDKAKDYKDVINILNYKTVSDGEFYDDLGIKEEQNHLIKQQSWFNDPGFVYSPIDWVNTELDSKRKKSQLTHALTRYDTPLQMRWDKLDKKSNYIIKVVYNGPFGSKINCKTDDGILIHDFMHNPAKKIHIFSIPKSSTKDGILELHWTQDKINITRGVSVSEIWLIKSTKP
ncbi:MAG: hypothetical protein RL728_878 [Bacteroidota bacterium]